MADNLSTVKSIIHLMLENRSFDNILGWLYYPSNVSPNGDPFNGLTGNENNPDKIPDGEPVKISRETVRSDVPNPDPGEDYGHVNMQLFGSKTPPTPPNANNNGFVVDYLGRKGVAADIMACYGPSMIPNLAKIAAQYAVCDAWYAPVPTQTWANRAFAHAATSWGMVNNFPYDPLRWQMKTIFQSMAAIDEMKWRVYYDESVIALTRLQFSPLWKHRYKKNFLGIEDFLHDANAGQLPHYAFVEPNFFYNPLTKKKQSDMHPPSDITPADEFIARVFNAVVTSPQWAANEVLLVITFDEHGGCYDHVHPPTNAVPPDDGHHEGEPDFDFKRFGVRVPAVVVSPFVVKGSVFHMAEGATPYDHTSILATIEKVFNIPALTNRDATAPDLGSILSGPARTDASPLELKPVEAAMAADADEHEALASEPLNDLQESMVQAAQKALIEQSGAEPSDVAVAAAAEEVRTVDDAHDFFRWAKRKTGL
jgi:phospholipase C